MFHFHFKKSVTVLALVNILNNKQGPMKPSWLHADSDS